MLVKTYGCALQGVDAITITIEVSTDKGFKFYLVGLPDNAIKESQRRIESALKNVGLRMPGKRITVNLAPADLRKEGSAYDLAIALAILAASNYMKSDKMDKYLIMGELSLDGGIQPLKGALAMAICAKKDGFDGILLPYQNAKEAAIVDGIQVKALKNLKEAIDFFEGKIDLPIVLKNGQSSANSLNDSNFLDFNEVQGQESIKRSMEIAAAGGHNVILIGVKLTTF